MAIATTQAWTPVQSKRKAAVDLDPTGPVEEGCPLVDPRAQSGHRRCKGDHEGEGAGETHHQHARHYGRDQINRSWSLAFADQVEVPTVAFIPISMKVHDSSPRVRA